MPVSVENSSPLKGILFDTTDNENNYANMGTANTLERSKTNSFYCQKESAQFYDNMQLNGTSKFSLRSGAQSEANSKNLGMQAGESPVQYLPNENLRNLQDSASYLSSFSSLHGYTTLGAQWDQFTTAPLHQTHTLSSSQNPNVHPFNSIQTLSHPFTPNELPDSASSYVSLDSLAQTDINRVRDTSDTATTTPVTENSGAINKSDFKTETNEGLVAWSNKSSHLPAVDGREAESQGSFDLSLPWNSVELPPVSLYEKLKAVQEANAVSDRLWTTTPKGQNLQQQTNDVQGLSITGWHAGDFLEKSEQVRTFKMEDVMHLAANQLESDSYNTKPPDSSNCVDFLSYANQDHTQSSLTCTSFQPEMSTFALSSSSSEVNEQDNLIQMSKQNDAFHSIYCKTEDEFSSSSLNPSVYQESIDNLFHKATKGLFYALLGALQLHTAGCCNVSLSPSLAIDLRRGGAGQNQSKVPLGHTNSYKCAIAYFCNFG
ncbi:unnamed protein product [Dibothriocephalus latus]|uniref:Uncharacterized protein n=1 Tax=Dibothriocephalus latus TaxID=60516 RepID=A0A3P6TIL5_DIBLA|nr:unnamed protein product [Dibothriocephalus latus]